MSLAHGSIKKNGNLLLDGIQVWVNCETDGSGHKDCWGYLNPEWEDPIGVNDPDRDDDPRYELELETGDSMPIQVWDHRDAYFVQSNQNGYRTVHFKTAR